MAAPKPDLVVKRPGGVTAEYRVTKDDKGRVIKSERIVKRKDGTVVGGARS